MSLCHGDRKGFRKDNGVLIFDDLAADNEGGFKEWAKEMFFSDETPFPSSSSSSSSSSDRGLLRKVMTRKGNLSSSSTLSTHLPLDKGFEAVVPESTGQPESSQEKPVVWDKELNNCLEHNPRGHLSTVYEGKDEADF